jgi:hypothetical protein
MKADTLRRRLEDPELPDGVKLLIASGSRPRRPRPRSTRRSSRRPQRRRPPAQHAAVRRRAAHRALGRPHLPAAEHAAPHRRASTRSCRSWHRRAEGGLRRRRSATRCSSPPTASAARSSRAEGKKLVRRRPLEHRRPHARVARRRGVEAAGLPRLRRRRRRTTSTSWPTRARSTSSRDRHRPEAPDRQGHGAGARLRGRRRRVPHVRRGLQDGPGQLTDAVHSSAPKNALAAAYGIHDWAQKKGRNTFGLPHQHLRRVRGAEGDVARGAPGDAGLWEGGEGRRARRHREPRRHLRHRRAPEGARDGAWLRLRLPSGRYLCYLQPKVDEKGRSATWA